MRVILMFMIAYLFHWFTLGKAYFSVCTSVYTRVLSNGFKAILLQKWLNYCKNKERVFYLKFKNEDNSTVEIISAAISDSSNGLGNSIDITEFIRFYYSFYSKDSVELTRFIKQRYNNIDARYLTVHYQLDYVSIIYFIKLDLDNNYNMTINSSILFNNIDLTVESGVTLSETNSIYA